MSDEKRFSTSDGNGEFTLIDVIQLLNHLRNLTDGETGAYCCACVFCGESDWRKHEPDCPWVAAKTYVKSLDAAHPRSVKTS
jgi:hypothetical protein